MEIKIVPCINGAYVETSYEKDEVLEGYNRRERNAYQFNEEESLEGLRDMFYDIMGNLGVTTSKRKKINLFLVLDNGYDYCGKDASTECPHCMRPYKEDESGE